MFFDQGWIALDQARWEAAIHLNQESLALARDVGDQETVYRALTNLGWIALYEGEMADATGLVQESLRLCHLLGEREVLAEGLEILAATAMANGDGQRAARLSGGAEALWEALHLSRPPIQHLGAGSAQFENALGGRGLGALFEAAWRQGQTMGLDELVVLALGCGSAPLSNLAVEG